MVFIFDIDDTLNDLHKKRLPFIKKYLKENHIDKELKDPRSNYFTKMYGLTKGEAREFWLNAGNNLILNAPVMKGAKKILKKLKKDGHRIIILTARDEYYHGTPYQLSKLWLDKKGLLYDELLVGYRENKEEIFKKYKPDFVVDDSIENCTKAKNLGFNTVVMKGTHNIDKIPDGFLSAKNWYEIYKIIKREIIK